MLEKDEKNRFCRFPALTGVLLTCSAGYNGKLKLLTMLHPIQLLPLLP